MRKKILFLFFFILTISSVLILNNQFNNIPPIGKFLNPYNGFWKNAEKNNVKTLEKINLKDLKGPVTVQFDSLLIPHIYSENDLDLFYTQGYIT